MKENKRFEVVRVLLTTADLVNSWASLLYAFDDKNESTDAHFRFHTALSNV
jgi:hypothetical protein